MHSLSVLAERGADYEFRLAARNSIDYGETTTAIYRTPDGGQSQLATWRFWRLPRRCSATNSVSTIPVLYYFGLRHP